MAKVIALFGPPGVGKSTLVKLAKKINITAVDLEEEATNLENRKLFLENLLIKNSSELLIIGSADLGPKDFPPSVITILLLPPKRIYLNRVEKRDTINPIKKGQATSNIYDLSNGWRPYFNTIIEEDLSPEETLQKIQQI